MKKIINAMVLFFIAISAIAQSGRSALQGTIVDNSGNPLQGVKLRLAGTNKEVQTNVNGVFKIKDISNGSYKLIISSVGYKTKTVSVTVPSKLLSFVIYEGYELLQEVQVIGRNNKFSRKKTDYVSKMPLRDLENSQVYSTVTNQLLISQSVVSFEEALNNATGITKLWASTGRSGDGAGYYSIRGFSVQPQLVNGVPGITNGFINPYSVERIEVIKGPSATLFGSTVTSYGGLINIVTKKPYRGTGGNIMVGAGSFGFKELTFDINNSLESNENISLRINTGYKTEDSFQDAGFKKSLFLEPSLSYKVNDRLTLNFNYQMLNNEQTNPTFLFLNRYAPLVFKNLAELNYDRKKSLTNNDVSIKTPTRKYQGEIAYKISDQWNSQTLVSGGKAKSDGYYTYLWNPADWTDKAHLVALPVFSLFAQRTNAKTNTFDVQQNFNGDFKIANLRNRMLIGFDYLSAQNIDKSSKWKAVNTVTPQGKLVRGLPVSASNIAGLLANAENIDTDINQNIMAAYISNLINIMPKLAIMAGVRYDRFNYKGDKNNPDDDAKAYKKSTLSPKFGAVYQPILNKLSVFANYQNGFSYVNPEIVPIDIAKPDAGTRVQSFDLEHANQLEFGVKTNLFNNKLDTTASYYNITVDNKVMGYGPSKQQDGKVKSKGIEIEVNANPIEGLNLHGGFSYNDSEITASKSRPDLINKRFGEAGQENNYNLWIDYKFLDGVAKNFGLGFGFNGASNYNTMSAYPAVGEFILPSYIIFNASAYYEVSKFRISIKANNLTDKEYYKGWSTVNLQTPLSFLGTLMYKTVAKRLNSVFNHPLCI